VPAKIADRVVQSQNHIRRDNQCDAQNSQQPA
jgi:hypothetical protein